MTRISAWLCIVVLLVCVLPMAAQQPASTGYANESAAPATPEAEVGASVSGSGTTNFIPKFTNSTTLGNSVLFQSGTGSTAKIGINTTAPASALDVKGGATVRGGFSLPAQGTATATGGFISHTLSLTASALNSSTSNAVNQTFRWQAEPAGNDTSSPTGTLNLLFAEGTSAFAETGLNIASNGVITGNGAGLTNVDASQLGGLASSAFAQLDAANTFTGNQTVNGNVSAQQLISLVPTFTPPLLVNSTTQVANLNASLLGGFSASAFPMLGSSLFPIVNTFTGTNTFNGSLTSFTVSGNNAASFVKGSSSTPTSLAAIQVENLTTLGEVAYLENGNASNPFAVLKLVQVAGAPGKFLQCERPDGTELCNIDNSGTFHSGSDFAEALPTRGARKLYEPGDVLVMASSGAGVEKTSEHYSRRVIGIFSTRPGFVGADKNGVNRVDKNDVPVAITGIVPAKVSAENGPVRVGDLLVTASTPGYAMKATDHKRMAGAIVGKALEPLLQGAGVIRVLVTMQ